jgi:hypothetical protein
MKLIHLIFLPLGMSCVSSSAAYYAIKPCENYTETLGPSHQCPIREGGALDEHEIRREFTSRVISEGLPLPHKEFGRTVLIFNQDLRYEARKLHFTQYFTSAGGKKSFLVYAEDSSGNYSVEADGTISLEEPDESTCPDRKSGGSESISAHIQFEPRTEPFRTIKDRETRVAFDNEGWLKEFHGESYWRGEALKRSEVQWPPFPKDKEQALNYRFEGFDAVIHYGCLNQGFAEFRGNQQLYLAEEFRYAEGVDPWRLRPGTRLKTSP